MAKDLIRKLGTISLADGTAATPFEIRTVNAIKRIFLRLTGSLDITDVTNGAVPAYGPADYLTSIQLKVNQMPGPFSVDGRTLYFKNLKDGAVAPKLTVPVSSVADNKAIQANLMLDFSVPHYPGGDMCILKPKLGNVYTLELTAGAVTAVYTNGAKHWSSAAPTVEVWAHEVIGLAPTPNVYNASYLLTETFSGANSAYRTKIPFGALLNELHLHVQNATPADSDAIVSNVIFRNGTAEVFRDISWTALKEFTDYVSPIVGFSGATPAGIAFLDLAVNNDFSSLLNTQGMKELELISTVTAAGSMKVLVNEIRNGLD